MGFRNLQEKLEKVLSSFKTYFKRESVVPSACIQVLRLDMRTVQQYFWAKFEINGIKEFRILFQEKSNPFSRRRGFGHYCH